MRFVLLLAVMLGWAHAAQGHAVLLGTSPVDGAALESQPREIVLRFNEPVTPVALRVLDRAGSPVDATAPMAVDNEVRLVLPTLASGTYLVSWRVISADAHPVGGGFSFAVGAALDAVAPRAAADTAGWSIAAAVNRTLFYIALCGGVGGFLFLSLVAGRGEESLAGYRRAALAATGIALLGAWLRVAIAGGLIAAGPVGVLLTASPWRLGWATTIGTSTAAVTAGLALVAVGLRRKGGVRTTIAGLAGAIAVALGLALTGHAAASEPRWLFAAIQAGHAAAALFWLGALPPLLLMLRVAPVACASAALRRFSTLAVAAVAVLASAGATLAATRLSSPFELLTEPYGRLVLAKIDLLAILLAIAAINRLRLTPALAAGAVAAPALLRRNIGAEAILGLAVLALTATLAATPPPQPAAPPPRPFSAHLTEASHSLHLDVIPARRGTNTFDLFPLDDADQPVDALEVSVEFLLPAAGVEAIHRPARRVAPGHYRLSGDLTIPGIWTARIAVLVSDFEQVEFEVRIPIE